MKSLVLLVQIGELFQGHFNWRGLLQLIVFVLIGIIIVGFAGFAGYKAFSTPKDKKNV